MSHFPICYTSFIFSIESSWCIYYEQVIVLMKFKNDTKG